jgi:hypothetical protein
MSANRINSLVVTGHSQSSSAAKRTIAALAVLAVLVSGCSYRVADPPAHCYTAGFTSFCAVTVTPDQRIVGSTVGIVPGLTGMAGGAANAALIDEGAKLVH